MYLHCLRDSPGKKLEAESPISPLHCPPSWGKAYGKLYPSSGRAACFLAFGKLCWFAGRARTHHSPLTPNLLAPRGEYWACGCTLLRVLRLPLPLTADWQQPSSLELLHRPETQPCIQTALVRHWVFQQRNTGSNPAPSEAERETVTEMRWQHWAPQCTQHGDRYSVVIWVAEQTKISLQDATMNGTTLFHLPQTKESGAQES